MSECTGQSRVLSSELRSLLLKIDDRSTAEEIWHRDGGGLSHHISAQLDRLKEGGFILIREVGAAAGRHAQPEDEDLDEVESNADLVVAAADEAGRSSRSVPGASMSDSERRAAPIPIIDKMDADPAGEVRRVVVRQREPVPEVVQRSSEPSRPPGAPRSTPVPSGHARASEELSRQKSVSQRPALREPVSRDPASPDHVSRGPVVVRPAPRESTKSEELLNSRPERASYPAKPASEVGHSVPPRAERSREPVTRSMKGPATQGASIKTGLWNALRRLSLFTLLVSAFAAVGVIVVGAFFTLYRPDLSRIEAALSTQLGEAVTIGDADLDLWPTPALILRNVGIGKEPRFKARAVRVVVNASALMGANLKVSQVEVQNAVITTDFFWSRGNGSIRPAASASFDRVDFTGLTLVDPHWSIPQLTASAALEKSGHLRSLQVLDASGSATLTFAPGSKDQAVIVLNLGAFQPDPTSMRIANLIAEGTMTRDEMLIKEFKGQSAGGSLRGEARLRSGPRWSLDGTVEARGVDLAMVAPPLFQPSKANGKARFSMSAKSLDTLFTAPTIIGNASFSKGVIVGIDIPRSVQESANAGNTTSFDEGTATFQWRNGRLNIAGMRLIDGKYAADGSAEVDGRGHLTGMLAATVELADGPMTSRFAIGGTLLQPKINRLP